MASEDGAIGKPMFRNLIISTSLLAVLIPAPLFAAGTDAHLVTRFRGHILLQVEQHGEAWYVRPTDGLRYYMKDGDTAYQMMRFFSQGITDADLAGITAVADTDGMKAAVPVCAKNALANRLKGQILLQVQQHGEAWYVDPVKCRRIYLKDGAAAYQIMRFLGDGIADLNLAKIPEGTVVVPATPPPAPEPAPEPPPVAPPPVAPPTQGAGVVQISSETYSVMEDAGYVEVLVTRTGEGRDPFTVHYATADGSATGGLDYGVTAGTLSFGSGETEKMIQVSITNDDIGEGEEMFSLSLSTPTNGAVLGLATAAITIIERRGGGGGCQPYLPCP